MRLEKYKLEKVCHLITDGKHGDCIDQPNSGYYFLSAKDIKEGSIDYSNARQITSEDFVDVHRRTKLEPNDILITNSGTIGRMALVPNTKDTFKTTFQKSVAIIKPNIEFVKPRYLYYTFRYNLDRLISFASGTAQKNLLLRDLRNFEVELPNLELQTKIASILSAYDNLIENNTRRIQILEQMAQTIYKEWFVNFRFPGHENTKFVDSPLGKIPEGWEVKELRTFGNIVTGKTPSTSITENFGEDIPFIKTPDMHGNIFIINTQQKLSYQGAESQSKKYLPPRSICVSCIGTAGVVSINSMKAQTNQQINAVILYDNKCLEFLFFALRDLKETINSYGANGATMVNLNKEKFSSLNQVTPSKEIIYMYSELVSPMFSQIENLIYINHNLRRTRDLLLPKLMSGEIEV
ncbi:MAG: restriction endonuclease subunit S [Melioribacteraceae bacterium]